jgi:hypothetical protein
MSRLLEIPTEHLAICKALVSHAIGEGPDPEDSGELEEFQEWILYLSGAMAEKDFECVVHLGGLEFDDDQVRFANGLDDDTPISDEQRLSYARCFIDTYGEDGRNEPRFAEFFELPAPAGRKVLYCCLTQTVGHGVILADWYGCFSDKSSFLSKLRKKGYWVIGDPVAGIPDEKILERWYHGPESRG